jgi:hypothetical protein
LWFGISKHGTRSSNRPTIHQHTASAGRRPLLRDFPLGATPPAPTKYILMLNASSGRIMYELTLNNRDSACNLASWIFRVLAWFGTCITSLNGSCPACCRPSLRLYHQFCMAPQARPEIAILASHNGWHLGVLLPRPPNATSAKSNAVMEPTSLNMTAESRHRNHTPCISTIHLLQGSSPARVGPTAPRRAPGKVRCAP